MNFISFNLLYLFDIKHNGLRYVIYNLAEQNLL